MDFRKYFIFSLLLFIVLQVSAQQPLWSVGTAKTLYRHEFEFSLMQPSRFGFSNSLEFSIHPVLFFLKPDVIAKKYWTTTIYDIFISSRHEIYYPSMLLNLFAKRELFNLMDDSLHFRPMVSAKNEILASKFLFKGSTCDPPNYLLTLRLGIHYTFKKSDSVSLLITEPQVFQEKAALYQKFIWYIGADLDAHWDAKLNYCFDVDFYSIGGGFSKFILEHKGIIYFHTFKDIIAAFGYKASFGRYSFGNKFFIIPLFDLMYQWSISPKKDHKTLFDDKMF